MTKKERIIRNEQTIDGQNGSKVRSLTKAEIKALAAYAWSDIKKGYVNYAYALLASLLTGMRTGELMSLKWSDVDLKRRVLLIHSQQIRNNGGSHGYEDVPWTKHGRRSKENECSGRELNINTELVELFEKLKADQESRDIVSEYVFCNSRGEWSKAMNYDRYLRKVSEELGFMVTNNALRLASLLNANDDTHDSLSAVL